MDASWTDTPAATRNAPGRSWLLLGAIALAQLFAFWLLCTHQVRRAEARHAEHEMAQSAMADCLQYIPGATIASCHTRLAATPQPAAQDAPVQSVSFTYR